MGKRPGINIPDADRTLIVGEGGTRVGRDEVPPRDRESKISRTASTGQVADVTEAGGPARDPSREYPAGELTHRAWRLRRSAMLSACVAGVLALLTGCVGPLVLERQVLGYDEVAKRLDEQKA
jgi:hypothetical protein